MESLRNPEIRVRVGALMESLRNPEIRVRVGALMESLRKTEIRVSVLPNPNPKVTTKEFRLILLPAEETSATSQL